jgi:hypothetical protein
MAEEVRGLRARVAAQEQELAQLKRRPGDKAEGPAARQFVDVSRDELLARASRCEIRYDLPPVLGATPEKAPADKAKKELGLTDTEVDALNETLAEVHATAAAELRRLYTEMSGDRHTADRLSPKSLMSEIFQVAPSGALEEARARLSRERAGLLPTPPDLSKTPVGERTLRLLMNLGDEFERKLGERIGAERAHGLRLRGDGWPGSKSSQSGC